jgi:hypothetical protein
MAPDELHLQVLGRELGEGHLGCGAMVLQRLHPSAEGIEGEGPGLVGVGEAVPLPVQLLEPGFGLRDAVVLVGGRGGLLFHPRGQLPDEGVGVEKQVPNRGPDGLVDADGSQGVVGAAALDAVGERGGALATRVVVVDVFAAGIARTGLAVSHVRASTQPALQEPFEEIDSLVLEAAPGEAPVLLDAPLDELEERLLDERRYRDLDPFSPGAWGRSGDLPVGARALRTVVVGSSDVPFAPKDAQHRAGRPSLLPGPCLPRRAVDVAHDAVQARAFLGVPPKDLTDHGGLLLVDSDLAVASVSLGGSLVPVGELARGQLSHPGTVQAASARTLHDLGPFVLRDGALDLEEELVVGRVGDGSLTEVDVNARALQLLDEQDLVGVLSGKPVGAEHHHDIEPPFPGVVPQLIQGWAIEMAATVALVGVGESRRGMEALVLSISSNGGELALDRPLLLLHLGGDARVEGRTGHSCLLGTRWRDGEGTRRGESAGPLRPQCRLGSPPRGRLPPDRNARPRRGDRGLGAPGDQSARNG